jgi:general transcription factor 3C polypeptide 5 (transcription factor C subunit 1)
MADFQYQPAQDDPLSKLRTAMASLDGPYLSLRSFLFIELSDVSVEGIRAYRLPQETEDYTIDDPSAMDVDIDPQLVGRAQPEAQHSTQRSNLRLFPPPIFSRQGISQNYKYVAPGLLNTLMYVYDYSMVVVRYFSFKANPMSTVTTVIDEKTGEEKERLINKGRWKGFGPTSITFSEKAVGQYYFSHLHLSP